MGCLNQIKCGTRTIIGIRDYSACATPESGLFINDIPGITLKNAAAIANEEQHSGYELLKGIIRRATELTFNDFVNAISSQFAFNAVSEIRKIKYFDDSVLPVNANERGLVLKRWRSEMAQIFIHEIYIKAQDSGTVTVKIIDGNTTKTYSVTLVADEEYNLRADYLCESESVKIVMSNASFRVYSGQINRTLSPCNSCGGTNANGFYMSGWNGSAEEAKYFGIGVFASVKCVEENIICQLLPRMSFIFLYRSAMLFYEELMTTSRLNAVTIYSKADAEKYLQMYTDKYERAYKDFVPTIQQTLGRTKGECITCNPSIKYANTIP